MSGSNIVITGGRGGYKNKYLSFYAAFNASVKAGNSLTKEEQVRAFTNDRTSSLRDLSDRELHDLVLELNKSTGYTDSGERQRRHIIAMAHEMGWELPDGKADMARIDGWVAKFGYLNKTHYSLNEYKGTQLPQLVSQFKKVYHSFLKSI